MKIKKMILIIMLWPFLSGQFPYMSISENNLQKPGTGKLIVNWLESLEFLSRLRQTYA